MMLSIIVLRDIKADCYKAPMFVPNINAAIRDLTDMVNDPQGKEEWQRHPEDFELYEVGQWGNGDCAFQIRNDYKQLLALSTLKG